MTFPVFEWVVFLLGLVVWGFLVCPILFGISPVVGTLSWAAGWFGATWVKTVYTWWRAR